MTQSIDAASPEQSAPALRDGQLDIHSAVSVQVITDFQFGRHRLWINVNGICVLRAWSPNSITLEHRT